MLRPLVRLEDATSSAVRVWFGGRDAPDGLGESCNKSCSISPYPPPAGGEYRAAGPAMNSSVAWHSRRSRRLGGRNALIGCLPSLMQACGLPSKRAGATRVDPSSSIRAIRAGWAAETPPMGWGRAAKNSAASPRTRPRQGASTGPRALRIHAMRWPLCTCCLGANDEMMLLSEQHLERKMAPAWLRGPTGAGGSRIKLCSIPPYRPPAGG